MMMLGRVDVMAGPGVMDDGIETANKINDQPIQNQDTKK